MELCRREEGVSVASFYFNSDCKQSEAYRTTEHATFPGILGIFDEEIVESRLSCFIFYSNSFDSLWKNYTNNDWSRYMAIDSSTFVRWKMKKGRKLRIRRRRDRAVSRVRRAIHFPKYIDETSLKRLSRA